MKRYSFKEFGADVLVDLAAGLIIAVGVYNFALYANFPVAGFSGIAIILYHLLGLPVGIGTILLNIPVAVLCYKFLGRMFFLKSLKSVIITSVMMAISVVATVFSGWNYLASGKDLFKE